MTSIGACGLERQRLEGRGDQLKEYVIGVQVFGKDTSFDPRADPIVRVQARRLRARLVRYYREEGGGDALVIELPKGGYAPTFKARDGAASGRRSISATLAGRNTIAVLPFADHSAARELDYFCQGLRHEVIHRLAQLEALRVVALPGTDPALADTTPDTPNAALLVSGSVRRRRIGLMTAFTMPKIVSLFDSKNCETAAGSMPGTGMYVPMRYTTRPPIRNSRRLRTQSRRSHCEFQGPISRCENSRRKIDRRIVSAGASREPNCTCTSFA